MEHHIGPEIVQEPNGKAEAHDGIWTTTVESPNHSITRLIREAEHYRDAWHIEGLWQPNAIVLVHSLEGEFKSILACQAGEALATGQPLMGKWNVPIALRVGILQTEMPDNMIGERLTVMYPDNRIPRNLVVSSRELLTTIRQQPYATAKFAVISNWLTREKIDILVWDTINNLLAACGNPNSEEAVAYFYELVQSLPHKGALLVRHDGKPSKDNAAREGNQKIRGSNLHAEIASAIIQLKRPDKRTNKVTLDIGKLRHGCVPEPLDCWFDAGTMRLTLLPPPVALLEDGPKTRQMLNQEMLQRFGLKERTADDLVHQLEAGGFLRAEMRGHERSWVLSRAAAPEPETPAAEWWRLVQKPAEIAEPPAHPHEICNVPEAALEE